MNPLVLASMTTEGRSMHQLPDASQWVGVIGSRKASPSEVAMARQLGARLAGQGRVVVSGLALGIDGAAHEGALSVPGGLTVAILSTAPRFTEVVHPIAHWALAERVVAQGALLHPFTTPADSPAQRRHRFLERDRLLAMLVSTIVVVADVEPISGGTRWAAGAGLQRGIPVFRLDSHGVFHKNPVVRPSRVDWDVECTVVVDS